MPSPVNLTPFRIFLCNIYPGRSRGFSFNRRPILTVTAANSDSAPAAQGALPNPELPGDGLFRYVGMGRKVSPWLQVATLIPYILAAIWVIFIPWTPSGSPISSSEIIITLFLSSVAAGFLLIGWQFLRNCVWLYRLQRQGIAESLLLTPAGDTLLQRAIDQEWNRFLRQWVLPLSLGFMLLFFLLSADNIAFSRAHPYDFIARFGGVGALFVVVAMILATGAFALPFAGTGPLVHCIWAGLISLIVALMACHVMILLIRYSIFDEYGYQLVRYGYTSLILLGAAAIWWRCRLVPLWRCLGRDTLWRMQCAAHGLPLHFPLLPPRPPHGEACVHMMDPAVVRRLFPRIHHRLSWIALLLAGISGATWVIVSQGTVLLHGRMDTFTITMGFILTLIVTVGAIWASLAAAIPIERFAQSAGFRENCDRIRVSPQHAAGFWNITLTGRWVLVCCAFGPLFLVAAILLTPETPWVTDPEAIRSVRQFFRLWRDIRSAYPAALLYPVAFCAGIAMLILQPHRWKWGYGFAIVLGLGAVAFGPGTWDHLTSRADNPSTWLMVRVLTACILTGLFLITLRAAMMLPRHLALPLTLAPAVLWIILHTAEYPRYPNFLVVLAATAPLILMLCVHALVAEDRHLRALVDKDQTNTDPGTA
jgi:hypothetical protein